MLGTLRRPQKDDAGDLTARDLVFTLLSKAEVVDVSVVVVLSNLLEGKGDPSVPDHIKESARLLVLEQKSSDPLDERADTGSGTLSSSLFSLSALDLGLDLLLDSWKTIRPISSLRCQGQMFRTMTYKGCTGGTRMHRHRSVKPTLAVTSRNMGRINKAYSTGNRQE